MYNTFTALLLLGIVYGDVRPLVINSNLTSFNANSIFSSQLAPRKTPMGIAPEGNDKSISLYQFGEFPLVHLMIE